MNTQLVGLIMLFVYVVGVSGLFWYQVKKDAKTIELLKEAVSRMCQTA